MFRYRICSDGAPQDLVAGWLQTKTEQLCVDLLTALQAVLLAVWFQVSYSEREMPNPTDPEADLKL